MKIAITTLGTRGDLQPYVALGLGLQQAGYDVLVVSAKNEAEFVGGFGLPYHALNVDIQQAMADQTVQQMAKGNNPLTFIISHLRGSNKMQDAMVAAQEEVWQTCQGADAIIYHPGMANAYFMAKELGIPSILASPFPITATHRYPSILFYNGPRLDGPRLDGPRLGSLYNRLTHWIFEQAFWLLARPAAKDFWTRMGKPDRVTRRPVSRLQVASGMPVVYGYSEHLFARPAEWPANVQVTGYWNLPAQPDWTPPADLAAFLQAGKPPVYIGFGSLTDADSFDETIGCIRTALAQTGQRAIVALGRTNSNRPPSLPDTIFLLDSAPHTWLFPRVSAVVHHGGAGTTAAGLQAGRPSLIIPHTADQPAWGRRVYELGVGPNPIPKKNLNVENLATALTQLSKPEMVANAAQLGRSLAAETGVSNAVRLIDTYLTPAAYER